MKDKFPEKTTPNEVADELAYCNKEGAKSKTYSVTIKSMEHIEQTAFQETEQFKELARNRYKIEAKNSELKNPHGYDTAQ